MTNSELVGWLVGCFGLNGPLRQYFSLYRAVSRRVGERKEVIDERKKVQTAPTLMGVNHSARSGGIKGIYFRFIIN